MSELTLEMAVAEFNKDHVKDYLTPLGKSATLDILAYKTQDTDAGLQINDETYETCHVKLTVYKQKNFANSFIGIHKSKKKDRNYEIEILHALFNGVERGCCISSCRIGECENEGIEISYGKPVKVSASKAAKLYASGKYLLRVKIGHKYEAPPVSVLNYGME